jgi:hypothetical protein
LIFQNILYIKILCELCVSVVKIFSYEQISRALKK